MILRQWAAAIRSKRPTLVMTKSVKQKLSQLSAAMKRRMSRLPAYMVPVAYVRMEAMPLTPNGKLDRKALPAPEDDAYASQHYEAPQGEIETVLASLWAELLKLDRVGRHDNFFELGGHSLLAIPLLGDRPRAVDLLAALVMATGVTLLLGERHGHLHVHEAVEHEHAHVHDEPIEVEPFSLREGDELRICAAIDLARVREIVARLMRR